MRGSLHSGFASGRDDGRWWWGFWDFGDGGEVSVDWAEGEVLDDGLGVSGGFLVFGEVGGGDLEAVEEHACSFWVDVELSEAAEDVVEGMTTALVLIWFG
jgi:hypothetical protein